MSKIFIDTNILVYANDKSDPRKQILATKLVSDCIAERKGVISTQVLQEYAYVALHKLRQELAIVRRRLGQFQSLEVIIVTPALISRALELHAQYKIHYWDAAILAAAEQARCDQFYSEDFPDGAVYDKVRVVNPLV
ncbi:MAG: PIN domain-containing protein, partial [Thermoguttaceae bacterium]